MTVSAFFDPTNGAIIITGKNDNDSAQAIDGILKNISKVSAMEYYYTDATHNFSRGSNVTVNNKMFSKLVPASCVFTMVSE
jgi:O-glycosyl hydrolase